MIKYFDAYTPRELESILKELKIEKKTIKKIQCLDYVCDSKIECYYNDKSKDYSDFSAYFKLYEGIIISFTDGPIIEVRACSPSIIYIAQYDSEKDIQKEYRTLYHYNPGFAKFFERVIGERIIETRILPLDNIDGLIDGSEGFHDFESQNEFIYGLVLELENGEITIRINEDDEFNIVEYSSSRRDPLEYWKPNEEKTGK